MKTAQREYVVVEQVMNPSQGINWGTRRAYLLKWRYKLLRI